MNDLDNQPKSPLSQKLLAAWLKHDPFVRIIAKNDDEIRRDAMTAMAGPQAAKNFFGQTLKTPPPSLAYPRHVREKETAYLEKPSQRSKIIRELVYWGTDEYLNKENPDSHNTRIQIIQSLLGPIFLNATPSQEKLIIEGLKVLVISRTTNLRQHGEQSPLVHQEILNEIKKILCYNYAVVMGKQNQQTESIARAHLVKTIQGLHDRKHRSAYYVADNLRQPRQVVSDKFPLQPSTKTGLLEILRHYTLSAWNEFRQQAKGILQDIDESDFDTAPLED